MNYRDAKPIYEQLKDGIRKLIVTQMILPGEKLCSVREMAMKLSINPNTIAKAYRELEEEGYVRTEKGKGTFVCEGDYMKDTRKENLFTLFDNNVRELLFMNVEKEELQARIERLAEGREEK